MNFKAAAPGIALVLASLLGGCNSEPETTLQAEDTVLGTQVQALNDAKAVEDMLLQEKLVQDEEILSDGG